MSEFSFATVDNFSDHIQKSIPSYSQLIDYIVEITKTFAVKGTDHYTGVDLGASTGELVKLLSEKFPDAQFKGYEVENNMLRNAVHENVVYHDITTDGLNQALIYYSIFTLQFLLSNGERKYVIQDVYSALPDRGAFIVAEKVMQRNTLVHDILRNAQMQYKRQHFTDEEILSKEDSLRRIMRPVYEDVLVKQLRDAGFKVSQFWRSGLFVGLLCIKEE